MVKKKKIMVAVAIVLMVLTISHEIYAKYIFRRSFSVTATSAPFYFDAVKSTETIIFDRTPNETDRDIILTKATTFDIIVKNNDGTNFNSFPTTYTITILDTDKFTFAEGTTITKTINGGSKIDDKITLNLQIKDLANPKKALRIRITSTSPYQKTIELSYVVQQLGAIQTIEDLLDLSLAVRGLAKANVNYERFMMTRDLDFKDPSSYDNAYRADYGNANGDSITENTLIDEMTKAYNDEDNPGAGFLPIGIHDIEHGTGVETIHEFCGTFNGGNHTLSNLRLHKAKQIAIGLFGRVDGAYLMNLTIKNGDVYNQNQTAGMLVGRAEGAVIKNITIEGGSVTSVDSIHTTEDTYAAGVAGFVELGCQITNCVNKATVTTRFSGDNTNYAGPAGGITAWMANSTIDGCSNYGTITGQKYIGGITGFSSMQDAEKPKGGGTVKNCHNYGAITTYITSTSTSGPGHYVGGIAGYNKANGVVTACTNESQASVHAVRYAGGIVGGNYGSLTNCHNYATNITANGGTSSSYRGGIYGMLGNTGSQSGNTNHVTLK